MNLWLVGQWKEDGEPWEFQGVFDTEEKAIAACRDDYYFVMPLVLNEERPHETQEAKGYYPKGQDNG